MKKDDIIKEIEDEISNIQDDIDSRDYYGRVTVYNNNVKEKLIKKQEGLQLAIEIIMKH